MDRPIIYTQEQGRSTDFLFGMRSAMIGLAKLSSAVLGANTLAHGFACTPNSPAALNVLVGLGEIYSLAEVDSTAYGVLPPDTSDVVLKQGIQLSTTTLSCPAPTTSGFSVNFLIEATYQDSDTTQVVLPYFNSANVSQPLNGPGGLGGSNATERQGIVVLQAKAGTPATTGTQTTPAPDSGYVGLWVVTVAFGATTITSGNISQYSSAPFITNILQMLQTGSAIYAVDTSAAANTVTLALTPPVTTYTDGQPIRFKVANSNTGAVTLNAGGGNISLTGAVGALQGGELIALKQYEAIYSTATGTAILIGQSAGALQVAPATASQHAAQMGQVQTGSGTAGVDTGAANAYVAALAPAITTPTPGAPIWIKIAHTNTGASTLNLTGTAFPILGSAHAALQGGELFATGWALFVWNATLTSWVLIECTGAPVQVSVAAQSEQAVQLGQLAAGTNLTTVAALDNSTKMATTGFVTANGVSFSTITLIGASRTLTAADLGAKLIFNSSSTLTIPTPTSIGARVGDAVLISNFGANVANVAFSGSTYTYSTSGQSASISPLAGESLLLIAESTTAWEVGSSTAGMSNLGSFNASISTNGYFKLPSGVIIQNFQATTGTGGSVSSTFPIAFPTAVYAIYATSLTVGAQACVSAEGLTVSTFEVFAVNPSTGGGLSGQSIGLLAIGK